MDISLTIIIPTIGRPTLKRVALEAMPQLGECDRVIVVGDGPQPEARAMIEGLDRRIVYYEYGPTKDWGHSQRNWAMRLIKSTHFMTCDDDDRMAPNALSIARKAIEENPDRPILFRMHHEGTVLWREPVVRIQNVSTQMIVCPYVPERLGLWGLYYEGDLEFIQRTVALWPGKEGAIVWKPDVIMIHGIHDKPEWNKRVDEWQWGS